MQIRSLRITDKKGTIHLSSNSSLVYVLIDNRSVDVCLPNVLERGADLVIDAGAGFGVSHRP